MQKAGSYLSHFVKGFNNYILVFTFILSRFPTKLI